MIQLINFDIYLELSDKKLEKTVIETVHLFLIKHNIVY